MNQNTLIILSFLTFFLALVSDHEVLGQGRKKQNKITRATSHAKSFIGTPYRYGGNSRDGIDCSSLIQQSYAKIGIKLPRTAQEQAKVGNKKGKGSIRPGDIVYFEFKQKREKWWHTGMVTYAEKGTIKFVHASSSRGVVEDTYNDYYKKHTKYFRRVIK
jgi:cell wall-associated NlpC family hydrolase